MSSDRRAGTRLPEDPAYWENLAARSIEAAFGTAAAPAGSRVSLAHRAAAAPPGSPIPLTHRAGAAPTASRISLAHRSTGPWWSSLSDAAYLLAASAVLALLGGSLLLDERAPRAMTEADASTESRALTAALAPDDPLLASLLDASAGPPSAAALLRLVALREVER